MRLYKAQVPEIARQVIQHLNDDGHIEVLPTSRIEAEADLVAIMTEYLNRDRNLREAVREKMARLSIPYDQYGRQRSQTAQEWGHPVGHRVEKYLAGQFVEGFMISRFVDEVFSDDHVIRKSILEVLKNFSVDENALRDEAKLKIKNIAENTVEYEIRLSQELREVKRRHGLID